MSESRDDEYLWDGSGEPDPTVVALEELLSPLGHADGAPLREVGPPEPRMRRGWWMVVAAAAGLVVALGWLATRGGASRGPEKKPIAVLAPTVTMAGTGAEVGVGTWLETGEQRRELTIANVGSVTVLPRSRVRLEVSRPTLTAFHMVRGELIADIGPRAAPRQFQVHTPAANVVDLGCVYHLAVADDGGVEVKVGSGRVALESGERVALVPAGATGWARVTGPWPLPRFHDVSEGLEAALEGWSAPGEAWGGARTAAARAVLAEATTVRDALPVWHLLSDADPEVAAAAHARLLELVGETPRGLTTPAGEVPTKEDIAAWRDALLARW